MPEKRKSGTTIKRSIVLLFLAFLFLIPLSRVSAQTSDTLRASGQNVRKRLNISDIQDLTSDGFNFWQDKFEGHFAGIDFGFNALVRDDYSGYGNEDGHFMDNELRRSNSLYLNLVQQSIGLQRNRNTFGLVTGIGFQLQSYRLSRNTTIEKQPDGTIIPRTLYFDDNQKSKLSSAYLFVPLLLEIQVPVKNYKNRLYFSAGVYGGLRLSSHTKIKYRANGKKEKLKTPDDFSLNDFNAGIMARAGYRWANLFVSYSMTPLFQENKGPGLTPVTVGFTLIQF